MGIKTVIQPRKVREMLVEWLREDAETSVLQEIYAAHFDGVIEIEPQEGLFIMDYQEAIDHNLI